MAYRIFTDATADMSAELLEGLPEVMVIPMQIVIDGIPYTYGPGGDISTQDFYDELRCGKFASTSQINGTVYAQYFEEALRHGQDVLYLCFSSGISGTFHTAQMCAQALVNKYPERNIRCIDTLCASAGEGFLVREALRKQRDGASFEQLAGWVTQRRGKVCHWFTVDTFEHLRHGGRVSSAAAMIGTTLQIKPMLHVSVCGTLEAAEKFRGSKRALKGQTQRFREGWMPELGSLVVIGHGDCPERAEELRLMLLDIMPNAQIFTVPIGPVIGAHTGPGVLALFYWGSNK